jgi:hypothetical protein
MTLPEKNQDAHHGGEEQTPAAKNRVAGRRRWIKAVGLAAVPVIMTVKAQPAWAAGPKTNPKSRYK